MTKKIEAIIRQEKLNAVKNALSEIGIVGLNVFEVRGRGRGEGLQFHWRTGAYKVDLLPRVQVNIILSDENVDATVKAIVKAAHTGEKGDGMIFVYPVENVIRISTGEEGREALQYQGDIDARKRKEMTP
ncbi:MAG: P-II family nitrogen regulator [Anaerolineae bacterium]|jgi:nitrogen regulatory protein P-II 1|nr:P-II family nitrogen regulator [Anaerolineae bacterium]